MTLRKSTLLDAGYLLLETHAVAAVPLMLDFIERAQRKRIKRDLIWRLT